MELRMFGILLSLMAFLAIGGCGKAELDSDRVYAITIAKYHASSSMTYRVEKTSSIQGKRISVLLKVQTESSGPLLRYRTEGYDGSGILKSLTVFDGKVVTFLAYLQKGARKNSVTLEEMIGNGLTVEQTGVYDYSLLLPVFLKDSEYTIQAVAKDGDILKYSLAPSPNTNSTVIQVWIDPENQQIVQVENANTKYVFLEQNVNAQVADDAFVAQ